MKTIGKVLLALLGGILFPILIWVALGVAINQKMCAKKEVTVPTIGKFLADAKIKASEFEGF